MTLDPDQTLAPSRSTTSDEEQTLDPMQTSAPSLEDETLAPNQNIPSAGDETLLPSHTVWQETDNEQNTLTAISYNQTRTTQEDDWSDGFKPPLLEHYQLFGLLGKGGMGRVYKALDTRLNRYVAIKFLTGDTPEHVARFLREARAQAQVEHENLCKVFEVDEAEGRPFIAMQLIKGQPLNAAASQMNLEEKLLVIKKVADGLHEAHRSGLVHRDLKPGNIMVEQGRDGRYKPYVLDFGLARLGEDLDLTMTGTILGTPSYMSPEQTRGDIDLLDRRTDVYGLGATLYYLLAGKAPFTGPSQASVLMDILERSRKDPSTSKEASPRM